MLATEILGATSTEANIPLIILTKELDSLQFLVLSFDYRMESLFLWPSSLHIII